jgi:predicted RNA binding protein YcfA (HicA-like mRNA interferase family)
VSRLIPCKRRDFIKRLRKLGFEKPQSGTRHEFMVYQQHRLTIPSNSEYSVPQLRMMIREVETIISRQISIDEWNEL